MAFLRRLILILVNKKTASHLEKAKRLSDEDLVQKIVNTKSTVKFGILYDRYSHKVYNKCISFCKDEEIAKDLTQDIFLKVYIKLGSFKGKSSFSTWLFHVVYNHCSNYVVRDKGKKMNNDSLAFEDHEYYIAAEEGVNVEEEVMIDQLNQLNERKLDKALDMIHPEEKSILLLKYQDDVSIKELEVLLNVGSSAVKMRLQRAKIKVIKVYNNL